MSETGEAPKQYIQLEETKNEGVKKSFKQKTMERWRKLFKKETKKPLELPMVEMPRIPVGSGLEKLLIDLKTGIVKDGMNEMQKQDSVSHSKNAAGVIEKNYFNFLRSVEGIQNPDIRLQVTDALNNGDMRVIAALAQNEYRATMDKLDDKPASIEKQMQNKKIHDKATELLRIRSQATLMGVDTKGIYQDSQRRQGEYWNNILNPVKDEVHEIESKMPVMVNSKADQELAEVLHGPKQSEQILDEGKKEE